MYKKEILYKVLDKRGYSCYGGIGQWFLPEKQKDGTWKPGRWMPKIKGKLVPCQNGYHLCRENNILDWLGESIFEAEYKGEILERSDKVVVREARLLRKYENWNEKTARLFACWCVRNTPLGNGGTIWNLLTDERSKNAVKIAEEFANGKVTRGELEVAEEAAWDAVRDIIISITRVAPWDAIGVSKRDAMRTGAVRDAANAAAAAAARHVTGAATNIATIWMGVNSAAGGAVKTAIHAARGETEDDEEVYAVEDAAIEVQTKELLRILNK